MEASYHRHDISDKVWSLLKPHLPGQRGQWGGIAQDNRRFINAVFWVLRTGAPWRDLPPDYGKWGSVHQRFIRWRRKGVWEKLLEILIDEPDYEWLMKALLRQGGKEGYIMAVYKEEKTGTWRVIYRYTDWTGERKQTQKRGFKTKRDAQAWEREQQNKSTSNLDMTFASFVEQYTADMKTRLKENTWATKEHMYHYHLHVVYIPVVEKQILWSKRCKDKSLVGTVKETITQVSSSKKWKSLPAVDEQGRPILQKNGKPVLRKSYSVLQDDFFNAMRAAGYTDVERGERGSSEEHLTVTQFKMGREQERLAALENQVEAKEKILQKVEQKIEVKKGTVATFAEIDNMGRKTLMGKVEFSQQEAENLKQLAKKGIAADTTIKDLQRDLKSARRDAQIWKRRYEELKEQVKDFLTAVRKAPERVMSFISIVLHAEQTEPPKVQRHRKSAVER